MNQYAALLRGINVGGNNLIKMTALKASFEALGFTQVRTYIQSGNVLFCANEADKANLAGAIEKALMADFNYKSWVLLRSHQEMQAIVARAPEGFGSEPDTYRYDVIYLQEPMTAAEAMQSVSTKEGVDQAFEGQGVLYFTRLISRASSSHLTKIISLPVYQSMTIRNWNTTTKLLAIMAAAEQ
jgi:uncharacterized protein (DUF1697 family)